MVNNTNLLAEEVLPLELGAVTRANSQPAVPFDRFGPAEAGCSPKMARRNSMNIQLFQKIE